MTNENTKSFLQFPTERIAPRSEILRMIHVNLFSTLTLKFLVYQHDQNTKFIYNIHNKGFSTNDPQA